MELVRKILLAIEASPEPELPSQPVIKGWSDKQVNYHLQLLQEAGYIDAITSRGDNMIDFDLIRLLWPGYDFLDAARDETVWNKAKETVGSKIASVSLDVLKDVLAAVARQMLGLP